MYPGEKELRLYVQGSRQPSFSTFIGNHFNDIVTWSIDYNDKSADDLFAFWKRRFTFTLIECEKEHLIKQSKSRFNMNQWKNIKTLLDEACATKVTIQKETMITARAAFPPTLAIINKSFQSSSVTPQQEQQPQKSHLAHIDPEAGPSTQQDQKPEKTGTPHQSDLQVKAPAEHSLHIIGYKKLSGAVLDEVEKKILADVKYGTTMNDALYFLAAQKLLKDNLSILDKSIAKLSLSGIVNLINPVTRKATMDHLCEQQKLELISENSDLKNDTIGLDCESSGMFDKIIELGEDIDAVLEFIQSTKATLSGAKRRHSQVYAMLSMVEQIIENFNLWYRDCHESEMTFYRRFATLLDIIFKETKIELADGETGSSSTRTAIELNKAVFETSDASKTYARKIDLLLKFDDRESVELCSNEWKKSDVSGDIVMKQQCKNLRINASVLSTLMAEHGNEFNTIMAMDWIGTIGYMYTMEKKNGVFISRLHDTLSVPKEMAHLSQFKSTLDNLFLYRNFMMQTCEALKKKSSLLQVNKLLWNIAGHEHDTVSSPSSPSSPSFPFIYFTPRSYRIQKRKLINLDD